MGMLPRNAVRDEAVPLPALTGLNVLVGTVEAPLGTARTLRPFFVAFLLL